MNRFFLPPKEFQGNNLDLAGREAHHALHVLRVSRGEKVRVLNGEGEQCDCLIEETTRDRLSLKVLERWKSPPLAYELTLAQAIPKGKLMETIIQKAAELGVSRIAPLAAQRGVIKLEEGDEEQKQVKWRQVAIEAIKQCGSPWLPRVEEPVSPERFAKEETRAELALVGSLQSDSQHPRVYFSEFRQEHGRSPRSVSVAVGPEGDFTLDELRVLKAAGALPISLGPLVLRTETAAVYCLSIINYELQSGFPGTCLRG